MFVINTQSKETVYEQLRHQIDTLVINDVLIAHDKLPSMRNLAMDLGINPNTVAKAYQSLESEGYIYIEGGKGCFIADDLKDKLTSKELDEFKQQIKKLKCLKVKQEKLIDEINKVFKEDNYD